MKFHCKSQTLAFWKISIELNIQNSIPHDYFDRTYLSETKLNNIVTLFLL